MNTELKVLSLQVIGLITRYLPSSILKEEIPKKEKKVRATDLGQSLRPVAASVVQQEGKTHRMESY